jgi:hypothetical protein
MLRISTSEPSARRQWVMSACQRSLGCSAQNVRHEERGRFCGCGVTNPRRDKIRQIVEVAGTGSTPTVARCAAIVSAPASRPRFVRVLRSRTTWSSISRLTARRLARGPARVWPIGGLTLSFKRLTSFCTQTREIP